VSAPAKRGRPRTRPEGSVTRSYSLDRRAHDAVTEYASEHSVSRSEAASALILMAAAMLRSEPGSRAEWGSRP